MREKFSNTFVQRICTGGRETCNARRLIAAEMSGLERELLKHIGQREKQTN